MIPHSRPTLPVGDEWSEVTDSTVPGWAADGPCVERFSREASTVLGADYGFAVNSGTSALHLALLAAGVQPGDEVLIPAYCCAALLNAVGLAGARPVLVDAEPGGFNLWPQDARRRRTSASAAVVVAHMFGAPAPSEDFAALGLPIIDDCAQSFGADHSPGAEISIASFYATKVITTGHGGLVATRDAEKAALLADRLHYDNREDWRLRFNYGLAELPAALGLWQLQRLPRLLQRRREIAAHYDAAFNGSASKHQVGIRYRYVLRVRDADRAMQSLRARGVDAKRPVYRPLHHYLGGDFPHAEAAHRETVSLPIYPALTDDEVGQVIQAVLEAALEGI